MKKVIWKLKLNNRKLYKCKEYYFGLFCISIVSLGIKNIDIRISFKWGWK